MVATLTQLVANLAPLVKRVSHNGRSYLVAPASLIVPGVLNGSDGAGYYPPEENAKSASSWDGVPLVAYHPLRNGEPVAAQDPEHKEWVWTNSGLGHLRNTRNNGKLTSEAWFDEELVKNYDLKLPEHVRIYPRLTSNRPIELSTGLMLDKEVKNGVCPRTGKSYEWVARNYKPDHLAVLPDQRGACSNEDGCGIVVNFNPNHDEKGLFSSSEEHAQSAKEHGENARKYTEAGMKHAKKGDHATAAKYFELAKSSSHLQGVYQGMAEVTKNVGKHGNPQHSESGQYLPHGSGTGRGEQHSAAVESHKNVPASKAEEDGEDDGAPLDNCMPMTTKNADGWVTLPNGVHVQVKDGEIVKGPKIKATSKEAADKKLDEDAKSNKTHKFPHGKNILEGKESSTESASFTENSNPEGCNQYKSCGEAAHKAGEEVWAAKGRSNKEMHQLAKAAAKAHYKAEKLALKDSESKDMASHHRDQGNRFEISSRTFLERHRKDPKSTHKGQVENTMTLPANERVTIVNKLVANCRCSEEDAKVINTLSDSALMSLNAMESDGEQDSAADDEETNSPKKKLPPQFAKNQETTVTVNQTDIETALAKSMGFNDVGHMRATLNVAKQVEYQQKENLLKRIVANIADDKKKELTWNTLKGKDVTELEIIANAIPAPAPAQDEFFKGPAAPVFTGANGGFEGTRNAQQEGFVLNADPEMDPQWHLSQKAKATAGSAA